MIQSNVLTDDKGANILNLNDTKTDNNTNTNGVKKKDDMDILGDIFDTNDSNDSNINNINNSNNNNNSSNALDFDDFFGDNKNSSPIKNKPNIQPKFTNVPYKNCVSFDQSSAKQVLNNISID